MVARRLRKYVRKSHVGKRCWHEVGSGLGGGLCIGGMRRGWRAGRASACGFRIMRRALVACALFALTACGPVNPDDDPAGRADTRQKPSNLTPGVHITGYANIGVVREF